MIDPQSLDISLLPWLPLDAKAAFPRQPAIYFAIDSLGNVQYVGRAINPKTRWGSHHRYDELQAIGGIRIAYLFVDAPDLLPGIEAALIGWFNPPLNRIKPRVKSTAQKAEHKETVNQPVAVPQIEISRHPGESVNQCIARLLTEYGIPYKAHVPKPAFSQKLADRAFDSRTAHENWRVINGVRWFREPGTNAWRVDIETANYIDYFLWREWYPRYDLPLEEALTAFQIIKTIASEGSKEALLSQIFDRIHALQDLQDREWKEWDDTHLKGRVVKQLILHLYRIKEMVKDDRISIITAQEWITAGEAVFRQSNINIDRHSGSNKNLNRTDLYMPLWSELGCKTTCRSTQKKK